MTSVVLTSDLPFIRKDTRRGNVGRAGVFYFTIGGGTPPKFNSSPLKNGGWKTIRLSYWEGNFSGAMLNFGRVTQIFLEFSPRSLGFHDPI